ncbi:MAG: carboxypeptidase-like regulatory domain-containing protein [Ginsengibacter sp.]
MEEKNKIYTAADFASYHAGTMSPLEMHALEKAALEDPFLDDALEGYLHSTAVKKDIAELSDRLLEKRKKKNVFFISAIAQNKWWRIAALFVIIAGGGYFFYKLNYANEQNSFAVNDIKNAAVKSDSIVAAKPSIQIPLNDSVTLKNNVALQDQPLSEFTKKARGVLPENELQTEKEVSASKNKPGKVETINPAPGIPAIGSGIFKAPDKKSKSGTGVGTATEYVLKGKVTDEIGDPVPFASITDKARHSGTFTDTAGNFSLQSQDSIINAMAVAPGYEPKNFPLKKDMQSSVAMRKTTAELANVVVTAPGKRKQVKEVSPESKALNGKNSATQIIRSEPQPVGGKETFEKYLEGNLPLVYDENNERVNGEVTLSFSIDKSGKPANIKVLTSTCESCEPKAIKLLADGPAWRGKKGNKGRVIIRF